MTVIQNSPIHWTSLQVLGAGDQDRCIQSMDHISHEVGWGTGVALDIIATAWATPSGHRGAVVDVTMMDGIVSKTGYHHVISGYVHLVKQMEN